MNQARSGRYYAEEFDERRPIPWMTIIALFVAVALLCSASLVYGLRDGFERGRAMQAQLARPTCPAPAIQPDSHTGRSCVEAGRTAYQQCVMEKTKARSG